ncbi:uncharacterized protein LOC126890912 [Diabrotica virgifera virgifera]|uniref:Uncharacterized protein n=1 Tax=Diabrotica virgifera virgifera TaxID=50390 RepID=A0ABM5L0S0_DIAVI|nr:uncharacterized protein LOC126890912 [Diabrotica virgifera virgifera]
MAEPLSILANGDNTEPGVLDEAAGGGVNTEEDSVVILNLTLDELNNSTRQDLLEAGSETDVDLDTNKIKSFTGKTVIPIFLYFDDYGINNPLGSHSTSILAGYYSFPTVPQYLLSRLQFIFNCAFLKTNDYKQFGNDVSFHHIIEELTFLEKEGIVINTPDQSIRVYFILGAVLGDNLGLNTIMGFTKSFNSNSFCRVCKRTKLETKRDCIQFDDSLRNENNYAMDLKKLEFEVTGLREDCVFNRIPSFHVLENFIFDAMHDLFEGVCHYDICNILLSLIKENIITLEVLNSRKNLFQYGETEVGYISSSTIDISRLNSNKLKMSARECWTFIHFLPLMLGDLVPKCNRSWKLLCLLLEMLDKILLPEFNAEDINALTTLIRQHN